MVEILRLSNKCGQVGRLLMAWAMGLLVSMSVASQPLALPDYVAGEHYQILSSPTKLAGDDKIEVMEVFWYGCRHCMSFEPVVRAWKKGIADDVQFMRTPAFWGKKSTQNYQLMQAHARLYYAVDSLGLPDEIHDDLFKMIVADRRLEKPEQFAAVFARYGVEQDAFTAAFNSFAVQSKANRAANRLTKNYQVEGTPELIVNGRYRISGKMAGGQHQMLKVVDFLVDLERKRAQ